MRRCRDISQLVSRSMDEKLGIEDRMAMRLHLLLCRHCTNFARQLGLLGRLAKKFAGSDRGSPPA